MSATIKLSSPATREFWEIPVLFEDEHLLALDKPAGLMVSPDPDNVERPSLLKLLHDGIAANKPWAQQRNLTYLNNAHRLDAEVSGVLLLAKTKTVYMALADQFSAEKPLKRHIALVWGNSLDTAFEVDAKISPHLVKPGLMFADARNGKKARTKCEVLERFSDWSLLSCSPLTERNHQVRVHLKQVGLLVVGDEAYGGKKLWLSRLKRDYRLKPGRDERPLIDQPALHAEELSLTHPVTNETVTIKSEWPKDMRVALKYLRLYATGSSRGGMDAEDQSEG